MLGRSELIRYNRQLKIPELGVEGQKKLKSSHAIITGIGGLGCASAIYLTAAGVGRITIVDFDVVELSNLNRQVLYWEEDIGKKKVVVAQRKLSKLNLGTEIIPIFAKITGKNVFSIVDGAQVVVDGLDNFATRMLVNASCVKHKIPYIHGGVSRFRGLITTIIPGETPCLACLYPEGSPGGEGLGVLGMVPGLVANLQSLEAIKIMIGHGPSLAGRLLRFNGNDMKFRIDDIKRNESCKVCSPGLFN
ncbi:MAG: moeB [Deltaproteobacteria bacterium]|nr:moeB [Deltaproteobacteria bacterium]